MKKLLIGLAVASLTVSTAQANKRAGVTAKSKATNSVLDAKTKSQIAEKLRSSKKSLSSWQELARSEDAVYGFLKSKGLAKSSGEINVRGLARVILADMAQSMTLTKQVKEKMNSKLGQRNLENNLSSVANRSILLALMQNVAAMNNGKISDANQVRITREMTYQMIRELSENRVIKTIESEAQMLDLGIGIALAQRGYAGKEIITFEGFENMGKVLQNIRYYMEIEGKSDVEARRMALEKMGGKELIAALTRCQ